MEQRLPVQLDDMRNRCRVASCLEPVAQPGGFILQLGDDRDRYWRSIIVKSLGSAV